VVTHQLQVERRTGKVRRPETDVLPLCHATNLLTHERTDGESVAVVERLPAARKSASRAFSVRNDRRAGELLIGPGARAATEGGAYDGVSPCVKTALARAQLRRQIRAEFAPARRQPAGRR